MVNFATRKYPLDIAVVSWHCKIGGMHGFPAPQIPPLATVAPRSRVAPATSDDPKVEEVTTT
jgi:hypothetical protein